jgi:hypothetical protein
MVNKNRMDDIINKFRAQIELTSKFEGLRERMKSYVEDAKGIVIDSILTLDKYSRFLDLIEQGKERSVLYKDSVYTSSGIRHNVLLKFEAGACIAESSLFPSPLTVADRSGDVDLMPKQFFFLMNVVRKFDGQKITRRHRQG